MNRDELLAKLDLTGKAAPTAADPLTISTEAADQPRPAASPTALQLDDWGRRRGREVVEASQRIQQALGWQADAAQIDQQAAELAAADCHGAAFEPEPQLAESCADPVRHDYLKQLLETPEYRALHATTQLDPLASEIAAVHFADGLGALRKDREEACKGKGRPGADPKLASELAAMRAVAGAVDAAAKEVADVREAAAACGLGQGAPGSNDTAAIAALYQRVRSSEALRRICQLAGRYRRVAQSRQRRKAAHGYDDTVGVTLDGDVGRLLPQELAMLADPLFELDAMRRLVERQSMSREYRAVERVGKGPIVIVVDESGSMMGEKGHAAKALALALAWIARHQRRWCALVAFSGGTEGRTLTLPPGRWNEAALLDWLEAFLGGGTTCDVPLVELPGRYWQEFLGQGLRPGKTDIVCITDAIVHVPAEVRDSFLQWKQQAQARMISLIIDEPPGDLAAVSDEVHRISSRLGTDEAGVETVLSI